MNEGSNRIILQLGVSLDKSIEDSCVKISVTEKDLLDLCERKLHRNREDTPDYVKFERITSVRVMTSSQEAD